MSGWKSLFCALLEPARLFMGAVFAGVVPFSTAVQQRPRSGEAESIQTIPITLLSACSKGGHSLW